MDRILDIAERPARLSVRNAQLVIEPEGGEEVTTPICEVAVLVLSQPHVSLTQAVVSGLAENGGTVVFMDGKHLPSAMTLPLQVHSTQTERFAAQIGASGPLRKRLWQQLVRAKIRAQGNLLKELHGEDGGLIAMADRVRSGDSDHLEAQASRRYWPLLFADPHFRRGREGPDQNAHLNYGYAILRATVSRALCAAGLHPSFGLQHHNRYDPFCLANDVMEPFRPVVDRAVFFWIQDHDPAAPLDKHAKAALLAPFLARYEVEGESRTLFDAVARAASDLAGAFLGQNGALRIAEV
jgi:CRISPR-associated protein Cas1